MAFTRVHKYTLKDRIQHHLLNWIVMLRYIMIYNGVPKNVTLKYLGGLERILKKLNIVAP
jgi:hypothetical protein